MTSKQKKKPTHPWRAWMPGALSRKPKPFVEKDDREKPLFRRKK